jgi:hypothetical protein
MIITGSATTSGQSTLRDKIYNPEYRTFTLDHWVVHDLYRNKEENGLLKNEVRMYYTFSDSLRAEINALGDYIFSLEQTIQKKDENINGLKSEIKLSNDLYNNSLSKLTASEQLNEERKKEIIELRRKSWVDKVLDFGWGPFKLKFLIPGAAGYFIGTNINL